MMKKIVIFFVVILAMAFNQAAYAQTDSAKATKQETITAAAVDTILMAEAKALFLNEKCNVCHSIEAAGFFKKANQKPPDLTTVGSKHTAEWLVKYLKKEETLNGEKHVKKFKGSNEELQKLVKWFETLK